VKRRDSMSIQDAARPEWSIHIQRLISRLKLSQAGLATRIGVSPATITRWIKGGHEPTSASYLAMGNLAGSPDGDYFWERAGVDLANFPDTKLRMTHSSLRVNLKDFKLVSGRKLSRGVVASKSNAVILPLLNITAYGDRVPPGPHVTLSQAEVLDVLMAPLSWCPHPEHMLCMHVSGDSMASVIPADSIISVDTAIAERSQLDKKLAVFSHRDLGFKVARFQRLSTSDILVSANHKYLPVDVSDQSKWKVVGAVVWWVSRDALPQSAGNNKPPSGT
jgi:transcriptional regulator with XRE-family HTH domain